MMKLIRGALDALKIVAKRPHDSLFHDAGFLCHACFRGAFAHKFPVLAFWKVCGLESTAWGYKCAQLLLNKQAQRTAAGQTGHGFHRYRFPNTDH